ncbi:MAG: hypothetical protein B7X93_04615 [Hydrogenophilales bacterium 17-61-9]|nr:MAG: hypothetical protein B7X93_04615 [Hydrogenophilales bacterium 17-61-9]
MNTKFPHSGLLKLTLAGAISAFALSQAIAAEPATSPSTDLNSFDGNKDGTVSQQEYLAKGGQKKGFEAGDANGDGKLDSSELSKAIASEMGISPPPSN